MTTLESLRKQAKRWLKALRAGDPSARERLRRADPSAPDVPGLRDVQHALARERGFDGWRQLAASAASSAAPTPDERLTAVLSAAERGDAATLAQVLDAAPDLIDRRGLLPGHTGLRTALHFGIAHADVVRILLERGADPNLRDEGDNACPLHFAAERGDLPVVQQLIAHGADPIGAGTSHELDVLGWAVCFEYATRVDVARFLLAHGARYTIHSAVALGDVEAVRRLVREGADLNHRMDATNHRRTPLHLAVVKRQPDALAALLELGADANLEDAAGLTPLDQAALAGDSRMAERLLESGARVGVAAAILLDRPGDLDHLLHEHPDLFSDNRLWARLLVRASSRSSGATIERLLRAATRHRAGLTIVNMEDDDETAVDGVRGYTPLHAAAFHGNTEAAAVLLRHGANPRVRDAKYFGTPAGWARYAGHRGTAALILEADVDIFDAIDADSGERVAQLLESDPAAIDRPFKAYAGIPAREDPAGPAPDCLPLQWAEARGKENARRALVERGAAARPHDAGERAQRVTEFLRTACWDHHVHGKRAHRLRDGAAQRMLARHPELARENIHTAVACGDVAEVERLIGARPGLATARDGGRGWSPLLTLCYTRLGLPATRDNAMTIARLLLDAGADPNDFYMAGDSAYTALVGVAGEGEQDAPRPPYAAALFALLLERGAEPFDVQVLYNTHFSGDMVWWLELAYAQTRHTPRGSAWTDPAWPMFDMGGYGNGARFVLETALRTRNMALAAWALEHGASPDAPPARDRRWSKLSLYQEAVRQGFDEMAALLTRHGAQIDEPLLSPSQRLLAACVRQDRQQAAALIDMHPQLRGDPAALFAAAERGRADVATLLVDLGVSPDVQDVNAERPLHRAAYNNALAVAEILVARGADVDARERRYQATPLSWAAHADHAAMIRFLAKYSRDFPVLCATGCVSRVRELLAEDPTLARRVEADGTTPLWLLPEEEADAVELVTALLDAGADPAARRKDGETPASAARRRGFEEVAALLERRRTAP